MILNEETVLRKLKEHYYATVITAGKNKLSSRTMMYSFDEDDGIYLITQKGTSKLDEIMASPTGLLHISNIEKDINLSYDISIKGRFSLITPKSSHFAKGFMELSKKNPEALEIFNSEKVAEWVLILFKISEINGWDYQQGIHRQEKTKVPFKKTPRLPKPVEANQEQIVSPEQTLQKERTARALQKMQRQHPKKEQPSTN